MRAGDERHGQIPRIFYFGADHQPDISVRGGMAVKPFRNDRILAVGHSVLAKISGPHFCGDYFQITLTSFTSPHRCLFPLRDGIALQRWLGVLGRLAAEMEQPRLRLSLI